MREQLESEKNKNGLGEGSNNGDECAKKLADEQLKSRNLEKEMTKLKAQLESEKKEERKRKNVCSMTFISLSRLVIFDFKTWQLCFVLFTYRQ